MKKNQLKLLTIQNSNLTPSELTRKVGWSRQRINEIESSKKMIQIPTLLHLAEGLNVNINEFLDDHQNNGINLSLKTKLQSLSRNQQDLIEKLVDDLIEFWARS